MNKIHQITCVIGTRPEALKMAPVINALSLEKNIEVNTILTAQHRDLLDQILVDLDITVTADFNIMTENQPLGELTAKILNKFSLYLKDNPCDLIIAQGDTTTTMVSALIAFYHKIPFAHIEAGLRTNDINNPFPEELNRRIITKIANLHFCPTETSKQNLEKENITQGIFVTGNTIIDTLHSFTKKIKPTENNKKIILITCHRRENFGEPLKNICLALREIVKKHPDVHIIYPVHPNPNVKKIVSEQLQHIDGIELTDPLDYRTLTTILAQCFLVLTDSGGLQEEAPALQKPVLILRNETERPEGVACGAAKIVGINPDSIITAVTELLTNSAVYQKMSTAGSPYGDGHAAKRVISAITHYLNDIPQKSTKIQVPSLKEKITQLESQIQILKENLTKTTTEAAAERQRNIQLRASLTYQLGSLIKNALTWRNFLKLPIELWRFYCATSLKKSSQPPILTIEKNVPALKDQIGVQGWPLTKNENKPVILGIMDEFTTSYFNKEVNLVQPRPDNWEALIKRDKPSFIFVESAWKGNYGSWQYRIAKYTNTPGDEIKKMSAFARNNKIPMVFWNKEDPIHHDKFIETAKLADIIFTTDANMIQSYKTKSGNNHVYALPFAAQPSLHKPTSIKNRLEKVCFAGSWYNERHPERHKSIQWLLNAATSFGLDIYDRNYHTKIFPFPDQYQKNIKGALPYESLCEKYSQYKLFLNVNSVINSPTMFSRRVFEILASGTPIVSSYSEGIKEFFGDDIVWMVNDEEEARHAISVLMTNKEEWRKRSLMGIRKIFSEHTNAHRLKFIYEKVGIEFTPLLIPNILIVTFIQQQEELERIIQFSSMQVWSKFSLFIAKPQSLVLNKQISENIHFFPENYFDSEDFKRAISMNKYDYIGLIDPSMSYDRFHLQDLVNATVYAPEANIWGKSTSKAEFSFNIPINIFNSIQRPSFFCFEKKNKRNNIMKGKNIYGIHNEIDIAWEPPE